MSRFGLRSASEVLKNSEEKPNRRKICNPLPITMKQKQQTKDSKYLTSINDENTIDDIKIEIEDVDRLSDVVEGVPRSKSSNDIGDEDEEDDGESRKQLQPYVGGLICSLPLDRISEVIQKLNLSKSKLEKVNDDVDESVDNDYDDDDDNNMLRHSTIATKNLCLYCDKKFSSHKMQLKHVEKFHCLQQDRRCSGRKLQLQQTQSQRKRKTSLGAQNFPGCTFCQKNKCMSPSIILPSSDLNALFVHLADCHPDKYFGCKACVLRFQNNTNLSKHMEVIHKILPFTIDENSCRSRDNDTDSVLSNDKTAISERNNKCSLKRQHRSQKILPVSVSNTNNLFGQSLQATQCPAAILPNTSIIGAEEPILSRLGLTQNRLPNNRKGVRLRREKLLPELLLKSEQNNQSTSNFTIALPSTSSVPTVSSPKLRGKVVKTPGIIAGELLPDVVFRVPNRNDFLSCVFDDNFYKEVVANVRNNLLFHLDGKIMGSATQSLNSAVLRHCPQPHIRSTLVKSPIVVSTVESEIHAATSLAAITAFPTLLTAAQFGGDGSSSKLRRPHTKNSWKWKWDSVKKFKLVNEGGKIVKKMKHPMFGLRDLSKLDMWTQLTMRKKRELQHSHSSDNLSSEILKDASREEKQRLNDQLNMILDMRILPNIILEQNEQAIIKSESDEFGSSSFQQISEDSEENLMAQTFADEEFLSMLNLLPNMNSQSKRPRFVLSGEWARPRCYLCMCCGAKFEKQKSLEEHKMFRHSQILSTHYEVVGRELLNGNLLRHLFLPKKALSRYANEMGSYQFYTGAARRLFCHKNDALAREIANNDESSDSLQSMINSCTNSPSVKNSSSTEDFEGESKITPVAALDLIPNSVVVSPTHSIQSCSSLSSVGLKALLRTPNGGQILQNSCHSGSDNKCSKCGRKCSGTHDLYRHMLDCSGDYVWSLAKKRKYRYYCGSKKRRPCNKHSILELRKNKTKPPVKLSVNITENTEDGCASTSSNVPKTKSSPRSRPSDAESIKKMLENLPPKRVCKKIFPALSKAKKNTKNIKPKMLSKHKIYNKLRKTRVRQMTQAAKRLSKSKSNIKQSIKMTTRSSTASSNSRVCNKAKNKKNKLKIMMNKRNITKCFDPQIRKSCEKGEQNHDLKDETQNAIKEETEKTLQTIISDNCMTRDKEIQHINVIEKNTSDATTSMQLISNNDKQSLVIESSMTNEMLTFTIESQSKQLSEPRQEPPCVQTSVLPQPSSGVSITPSRSVLSNSNTNQYLTNVRNVKRSKRISDCIAMLTGKLEQKLKTERNVFEAATRDKNITKNNQPQESVQCAQILPPMSLQANISTLQSPVVSSEISNSKAPTVKKTPKRKTVCRRIIKGDGEEEPSSPEKVLQNSMVQATNAVEVFPTVTEMLLTKVKINQEFQTPLEVEQLKESNKTFFPEVDGSKLKSTPTVPKPSKKTVIPINSHGVLPLCLPADKVNPPRVALPIHLTVPQQLPIPVTVPIAVQMPAPVSVQMPMSVPVPVSLPVPLPVPVTPPIPKENTTNSKASDHNVSGPISAIHFMPPTAIPLITAFPPSHIPTPSNISMSVNSFSIPMAAEPLNLSNSSKIVQKQSQDLSCSGRQKLSGPPARRQTICGFESRNFVMFDEIEPLDLSKKSKAEKPPTTVQILPTPLEIPPVLLPVRNNVPLCLPPNIPADPTILPVPPLPAEALLNKPFYSNLDLLRIPQVRNPAVGQASSTLDSTPTPSTTLATKSLSNASAINTPIGHTAPIKSVAKKRSKVQTTTLPVPTLNSTEIIATSVNNTSIKHNYAKESCTMKKDTSAKSKVILRMDEEVINHIDDAINSVINAVKASLDNEEAEKSKSLLLSKTTDDVSITKESVTETKKLTASRRNMRSKTLDCRPAALNKIFTETTQSIPIDSTPTSIPASVSVVHQTISVKNINELREVDINVIGVKPLQQEVVDQSSRLETSECNSLIKESNDENKPAASSEKTGVESFHIKDNLFELTTIENQNTVIKPDSIDPINISKTTISNEGIRPPLQNAAENITVATHVTVPETEANIPNPTPTNPSNLDEEQMSNNNNTSSGFHSSAQSDQQISIMSTNTSASVAASILVCDTKKKQRRRRKNELAAIVADQLLESFKLDKARRDNLKKLENLAYEKSEDLLLTGMLLMSSTKRNVNCAQTPTTSVVTANVASMVADSTQNNKRNNKFQQISDSSKPQNETICTENKIDNTIVLENVEINDGKKSAKRKQYRRRGKTVDNENISKLKSSLESFSIDIERQLTEYEAKNVNVFKNLSLNETDKTSANSSTLTSGSLKPSIILRPSILSMTMEGNYNVENPQLPKSSVSSDTSKTVVSSRDPRLNKNIHKEDDKYGDYLTEDKLNALQQKQQSAEIADMDEDNYLTEIAKNVNEKIMSTENEEFAFKDDGFELANEIGPDDSNSKFSRPPTSMSVRSAPNFNDERSNFGSICDENTNTEVMDMDLDDEMSVYTSYSQDLGRGRGRRRRRRRSILLTRKPKKRATSRDLSAEKIECILCKKVFYSANSLTKHNMTLAHVSKVSEQEYLLSKSHIHSTMLNVDQTQSYGTLGPYARRSTRRATISEPPSQLHLCMDNSIPTLPQPALNLLTPNAQTQLSPNHEFQNNKREESPQTETIENATQAHLQKVVQDNAIEDEAGNNCAANNPNYNENSRLNLNPDERLFFECCNILKSAETPRINNVIPPEECNNLNTSYAAYSYSQQQQSIRDRPNAANQNVENITVRNSNAPVDHQVISVNSANHNQQPIVEQSTIFRGPQYINVSNCYNKTIQESRPTRSPTYSAISHLSAVTNTTSRFKTKAAMKGYENNNLDLIQHQESKSRTICKLTELAEIALGNEEKPNSHSFSPIQCSTTSPRPITQVAIGTSKVDAADGILRDKELPIPEYASLLAVDNPKDANVQSSGRNERTKNNETRSSTSSKTIMHSSIIKAAVEEHQKVPSSKIIIPERPFKNIGLEEKESITFQKPRTPAMHLLTEDNNSVSTGSFSDRDDYDFGSMSCEEELSVRESNDKNPKNNTTESSSESSRATAKTFENKSLIMGRIFKNVSTKTTVKNNATVKKQVKSVGVQKDQVPTLKADLNQLFDELRGNSVVEPHERNMNVSVNERPVGSSRINYKQPREAQKHVHIQPKQIIHAASPPAIVSSTTATPSTSNRKTKTREPRAKPKVATKSRKDISKLQSELGMSPDEIKKLIDDGQRKSKRRCATNRPKKLVEMWSSDEYEEFLSTKDIIALIEEKEQQEKLKKRKNSVQMTSNTAMAYKEKDTSDVTSSTKEPKRKNSRKAEQDNCERGFVKPKKPVSSKKENVVSTTAIRTEKEGYCGPTKKNISQKTVIKVMTPEISVTSRAKSTANSNKHKTKSIPKTKQTKASRTSKSTKRKTANNSDDDDNNVNDDDDDEDFLIADLKQKQINKPKSRKDIQLRATLPTPVVTSSEKVKPNKSLQISKKRQLNSNSNLSDINLTNVTDSTSSNARAQKQAPQKTKRKNQSNQSVPRRKRTASEKLYYWSSSSDEDFGRIKNKNNSNNINNKNHTSADNFDGEQYQKHGWIVGDSHKKLVTLLAIAKGNKKVDANGGVKKNVSKKRI